MKIIKNSHLLEGLIELDRLELLEHESLKDLRAFNIHYKIKFIKDSKLDIDVQQTRSRNDTYMNASYLELKAQDLFSKYFPDFVININANTYNIPEHEIVTSEWLRESMVQLAYIKRKGNTSLQDAQTIALKEISIETGIDKPTLSVLINGKRPLSKGMKGLFYNYFIVKNLKILSNMIDNTGIYDIIFFPKFVPKVLIEPYINLIESKINTRQFGEGILLDM